MELQKFSEEKKEKALIEKILRILIIGFLVMIVILLVDATGIMAQMYEKKYQDWPESWIVKPIAEWYEEATDAKDRGNAAY